MFKFLDEASYWFGYLVGLYEGEGSINIWSFKTNPNRVYAKLWIRMTDESPTLNIQRAFGGKAVGAYLSPKEAAKGYKPKYRWVQARVDEVLRLTEMMLPFLSPRRQAQLQAALDVVVPTTRRPVQAGNRRQGQPLPLKPRRTGQLVCPPQPEPSTRGYLRHKLLGIPVCPICHASWKLYYAEKRKWDKTAFLALSSEEQETFRARQRNYVRAYRERNKDKVNSRQQALREAKLAARRELVESERRLLEQLKLTP